MLLNAPAAGPDDEPQTAKPSPRKDTNRRNDIDTGEDVQLLEHRREVVVPQGTGALFVRRSYTHVDRKAQEGQFDEFKYLCVQ